MRLAFVLSPNYQNRPDLGRHATSEHDAQAFDQKLSEPGFDFEVVRLPAVDVLDEVIRQTLDDRGASPDDPVIVHVSAFADLDDAGELSVELDPPSGIESRARLPLTRLRSAMASFGVRGAAIVLDLVYPSATDPVLASEYVASARRVFAPELSGYALLCSVRSREQASANGAGPSPFTALWLRTLDQPEVRNAAGAVVVSQVMDQMREDPDLYTDVPCFALVAGRRDVVLFSATGRPSVPPSSRLSAPSSSGAVIGPDEVIVMADEAYEQGQWGTSTDLLKKALLLLGEEKSPRRAHVYNQLAEIKVSQGRRGEAVLNFKKALSIAPQNRRVLGSLADLFRAEGEFIEATETRRQLLEATTEDEDRFHVLLVLADDHEKARSMSGTIEALEAARAIHPEDTSVLARLAQAYDSEHAYDQVVDIKVALAGFKGQAEEIARSLVLAADFAAERAYNQARALEIYEQALDQDPLNLRAFDSLASILSTHEDWNGLEGALLRQGARLDRVEAHAAEAAVWRDIAVLRRRKMHNPRGAIEALDRCVERLPTDVEARVALAELLEEVGDTDAAVMSLEIAAWHAPGRVDTYRFLYKLFHQAAEIDRAYLACGALIHLDEADLDEQVFHDQYHPEGPIRPSASLDKEDWEQIYPPSHDRSVRAILHVVAPAAIEHKLQLFRKENLLPELDPAARQDPEKSTVSLTRTFVWACTVFDTPVPEIYVGDEVPGGIAAVPAESPTALVGKSVLRGRSLKELAFLVARDITYYRPEHYILVLYSTLDELRNLFLASLRVARPDLPVPQEDRHKISALSKWLRGELSEEQHAELVQAVDKFDEGGGRIDFVAWARSIEIAATRAGLLVCGDLSVATTILQSNDRNIAELSATDLISDLVPFSVSEAHARLRARLGIAVKDG